MRHAALPVGALTKISWYLLDLRNASRMARMTWLFVMDRPVLPQPYRGGTYKGGGWHPGCEWEGGMEGARVSLGGSGVLEGAGI